MATPTRRSLRPTKTKRMQDFVQFSSANKMRKKDSKQKHESSDNQSAKNTEISCLKLKENDKMSDISDSENKPNDTSFANKKQAENEQDPDYFVNLGKGLNKSGATYEHNTSGKNENASINGISIGTNTLSEDDEENDMTPVSPASNAENVNSNKKGYKCEKCFKILRSKDSLSTHMYRHTGQKPHKCTICGMAFSMKSYLVSHIQCHNNIRTFICEICGKGFGRKATLITHMLSHTDKKEFACDQCDKTFKQRHSLIAHQSVHAPDQMWVCHQCGKSFSCKNYLVQHLKSHSGSSSFRCELCDKTFKCKQTLEEHCRRHIGQKIEMCQICSKKYYNKKELNKHMKFHNTRGDYKCEPCKMFFTAEKSLAIHNMKIHSTPYKCSECDLGFTLKRKYTSHMRTHYGSGRKKLQKYETANFKKERCPLCDKILSNKYRLQKHFLTKHGLNKPVISEVYYDGSDDLGLVEVDKVDKNEMHWKGNVTVKTNEKGSSEVVHNGNIYNLFNGDIGGLESKEGSIIYIVEEEMPAESSESRVVTLVDSSKTHNDQKELNSGVYEEIKPQDLENKRHIDGLETGANEEVVVILNKIYEASGESLPDNDSSVYLMEEDGSVAYSTVDHEVVIQPDNSVVACIDTPIDDQIVDSDKSKVTSKLRDENKKIQSAYEIHRHFEPSFAQPTKLHINTQGDNPDSNRNMTNIQSENTSDLIVTHFVEESNKVNSPIEIIHTEKETDIATNSSSDSTEIAQVIIPHSDNITGEHEGVTNTSDGSIAKTQIVSENSENPIETNLNYDKGIKTISLKDTSSSLSVLNADKEIEKSFSDNVTSKLHDAEDNIKTPSVEMVDNSKTPLVEMIDSSKIPLVENDKTPSTDITKTEKAVSYEKPVVEMVENTRTKVIETSADVKTDSVDDDFSLLEGILPLPDSKNDFTKFENSLVRGIQSLRNSEHYSQLLSNVLDFVVKEQTKLASLHGAR